MLYCPLIGAFLFRHKIDYGLYMASVKQVDYGDKSLLGWNVIAEDKLCIGLQVRVYIAGYLFSEGES